MSIDHLQHIDVNTLFGEKLLNDTETVEQLRRGTRTRPRKTSLTHGKRFLKLMSSHHGLSDLDIAVYENKQMHLAELEQISTDKFWGLDKEYHDELIESNLMKLEDEYSYLHEHYCKIEAYKKLWEEQEIFNDEQRKMELNDAEDHARISYLQTFYSVANSGDIINYKWPTNDHFTPGPEIVNECGGEKSFTARTEGYEIWNLVGEPSTIHLDGLQQSRTISLNGETHDPRKTASIADLAMRPAGTRKNKPSHSHGGHSSSHHQLHTQHSYSSIPQTPHSLNSPSYHGGTNQGHNGIYSVDSPSSFLHPSPPHGLVKESSIPSLHSAQSPSIVSATSPVHGTSRLTQPSTHRTKVNLLELNNAKYLTESNKLLLAESSPKYCDLLDGHPHHHWDSKELLRAAFQQLDVLGAGHIRRENISELGNNRLIHHYLRYTLFWMSIKRRRWAFFYSMFDDFEETINVDVWIAVHEMICIEDNVQLSHIRTINEHKQSCAVGTLQISGVDSHTTIGDRGSWMDLLDDKAANNADRKKYFASEQRKRLFKFEREASLLRSLRAGDFVWGLYNKGCVWYPAVIEDINIETKEVKLKYLMTTDEVKKYQSLTISRQYLPRNGLSTPSSARKTDKNTPSSNAISLPQSIHTEKELCEYIFDQIVAVQAEKFIEDSELSQSSIRTTSSDYIDCKFLVQTLKSSEYRQIILCSANLTALFHPSYHLDDQLLSMFRPSTGDHSDESNGMISKTEFIEYCDLVKDIFIYTLNQ